MYENSKLDKINSSLNLSQSVFHSTLNRNAKSLNIFAKAKKIKIITKNHIELMNNDNKMISLNNNNIANCIFN